MTNIEEIWKDIPNYNCYQVSSLGRVRSKTRKVNNGHGNGKHFREGVILKPRLSFSYLRVAIANSGLSSISVHRLVATTFIPNPLNKPDINHINGVKSDNRVENLEWCTHKENIQHAFKNGLSKSGENSGMAKLKDWEVRAIRFLYPDHYNLYQLAEIFGVSRPHIGYIVKNKSRVY